jgi:hypothetical protein
MATALPRDPAMSRWQRALLPAVEGSNARDGEHLRRSVRDWLVDIVIFTFAVGLGVTGAHDGWHSVGVPMKVIDVAVAVVACLSLWIRRRHPLAIGLFTVGASAISVGAGGAALAGMFTVAVHCPPRWTARVAVLSVVASAVNPLIYGSKHHYSLGSVDEIDVDGNDVPPLIGRTAYRLVQEGLTNARKHAPGQRVQIAIAGRPRSELTVEVVNRPLVGHASRAVPSDGSGTGLTGLIGLAERVQLTGGQLSHETLNDGGFALRASLPWT